MTLAFALIYLPDGLKAMDSAVFPGARTSLIKRVNVSNLWSDSRLSRACPFWIQCFNCVRYIRDTVRTQPDRGSRTIQCFTAAAHSVNTVGGGSGAHSNMWRVMK